MQQQCWVGWGHARQLSHGYTTAELPNTSSECGQAAVEAAPPPACQVAMHDALVGVKKVQSLCHVSRHLAPPAGSQTWPATLPTNAQRRQTTPCLLRHSEIAGKERDKLAGGSRQGPPGMPRQHLAPLVALQGPSHTAAMHELHDKHHKRALQAGAKSRRWCQWVLAAETQRAT